MGLRFRKSIKIAPGVKLNLGKKSAGISIGGKHGGLSYNTRTGTRARVSAPGTGLSYSTKVGSTSKRKNNTTASQVACATETQQDKWLSFLLCLFAGFLGIHKFYEGKIGMGILYLLTGGLFSIGWIYDIIKAFIELCNSPVAQTRFGEKANLQSNQKNAIDIVEMATEESHKESTPSVEHHKVTGTSHYTNNILVLAEENPAYDFTKTEIVNMCMYDEKIYQYDFLPHSIDLIEEPENEYDSNAIKVVMDGEHVGYIKKGSCAHIKKLIREDKIQSISGEIHGGQYKIVLSDYDDEKDEDVYIMEKDETGYYASIYITLK